MGFLPLVCNKCGASIQLDENHESGFCLYCGTRIILEEALAYKAKFKYETNIDNLMHLAMTAFMDHDYQEAIDYFSKVLEHETNNPDALFYKSMAKAWRTKPDTISFDAISNIVVRVENYLQEKYAKISNIDEREQKISQIKYNYAKEYYLLVSHVIEEMNKYIKDNPYGMKPIDIYLQQICQCMHAISDCTNLIDDYAIEHIIGAKKFLTDRMKEVVNWTVFFAEKHSYKIKPSKANPRELTQDCWVSDKLREDLVRNYVLWVDNVKKYEPTYSPPPIRRKIPGIFSVFDR